MATPISRPKAPTAKPMMPKRNLMANSAFNPSVSKEKMTLGKWTKKTEAIAPRI